MLLRRITKHVTDQNWFAVFIDFLIVVVGVFIGIQVANWNEERQDRKDENAMIITLHDEMVESESLTANIIDYRTQYAEGLAIATNIVFGLAPERELTASECNAIVGSDSFYFGRAELPALKRLQVTGRLDIVRDKMLNKALGKLIQRKEALENVFQLEKQNFNLSHLYPEVFNIKSDLVPRPSRKSGIERSLEATCNLENIKANQRLLNDIAKNADSFDAFVRDGLGPWLAQTAEVHKQLDRLLLINHNED